MQAKIVGHLGTIDPIEWGGGVVFFDGDLYWIEYTRGLDFAEAVKEHDEDIDELEVYRVDVPDDVLEWHDWVDLDELALFSQTGRHRYLPGLGREGLYRVTAHPDVMMRAILLDDIAALYGWEELDPHPVILSLASIKKRWELPRKR